MKGAKGAHVESQPSRGSWMTVDQAAVFLHLPCVTLRRALERNARKLPEGGITSSIDGIAARKLGRLWRVWLDAGWLNPGTSK
ncbi:MAG: hypothetical protein ACMG6S_03490 [Byssovorax sp.]